MLTIRLVGSCYWKTPSTDVTAYRPTLVRVFRISMQKNHNRQVETVSDHMHAAKL